MSPTLDQERFEGLQAFFKIRNSFVRWSLRVISLSFLTRSPYDPFWECQTEYTYILETYLSTHRIPWMSLSLTPGHLFYHWRYTVVSNNLVRPSTLIVIRVIFQNRTVKCISILQRYQLYNQSIMLFHCHLNYFILLIKKRVSSDSTIHQVSTIHHPSRRNTQTCPGSMEDRTSWW